MERVAVNLESRACGGELELEIKDNQGTEG